MASSDSFDLYTCEVCLENMLDKNPRLLSCHHSFCTECLRKLMKGGAILCPTCRKSTTIPNNNIELLPANFMLLKFKTHLNKLHENKSIICQLCLAENAVLKCQECIQLLCENCSHKHGKVKTFKDHKLYKLCQKHKEGMITYLCMKCAESACSKCVMVEHLDHEAEVETYENGIKQIEQTISRYASDIDRAIECGNKWKGEDMAKLENVKKTITRVVDIKQYYLEKAGEVDQVLETLHKEEHSGEKITQLHGEKIDDCIKSKSNLQSESNDFKTGNLGTYLFVTRKINTLLHEVKQKSVRFNPKDIMLIDPRTVKVNNLTADVYLAKPVMVKKINCPNNQRWSRPVNITMVNSECVLIADWDKEYLTFAYSSDIKCHTIASQYGIVRDVSMIEGHLYRAYENKVSRTTFNNGNVGIEEMFNPRIRGIVSMAVLNHSCVFLLSQVENRIIQLNPNNNHSNSVVTDLVGPIHMNIIKNKDDIMYAVSCHGTHCIYVYNDRWTLLFTCGEHGTGDRCLMYSIGTTYTKDGILVADYSNHRITLFSFDGKFIKHILTQKDDITHPIGLVFISPCLWVSQASYVTCFKLCE